MGGVRQHCDLHGSVEIALTADVAVAQGLVVGRLVEKSAIKAVLEDRTDRGNRASLDQDAASAGGILIKARSVSSIRSILKNGLDRAFLDETSDHQPLRHGNIRGQGYFH